MDDKFSEENIRLLICEHDETIDIIIEEQDNRDLYKKIDNYYRALVNHNREDVKKENVFKNSNGISLYIYYDKGYNTISEDAGIELLLKALGENQLLYRVDTSE